MTLAASLNCSEQEAGYGTINWGASDVTMWIQTTLCRFDPGSMIYQSLVTVAQHQGTLDVFEPICCNVSEEKVA